MVGMPTPTVVPSSGTVSMVKVITTSVQKVKCTTSITTGATSPSVSTVVTGLPAMSVLMDVLNYVNNTNQYSLKAFLHCKKLWFLSLLEGKFANKRREPEYFAFSKFIPKF